MLDTLGYKYTFCICNIYLFPTTTTVAQTSRAVKLHARDLSCWVLQEIYQHVSRGIYTGEFFINKASGIKEILYNWKSVTGKYYSRIFKWRCGKRKLLLKIVKSAESYLMEMKV